MKFKIGDVVRVKWLNYPENNWMKGKITIVTGTTEHYNPDGKTPKNDGIRTPLSSAEREGRGAKCFQPEQLEKIDPPDWEAKRDVSVRDKEKS